MIASGAAKILRFNWPWYVAAIAVGLVASFLLRSDASRGAWRLFGTVGLGLAAGWLLLSIAVSYWIYDRSGVARGAWLDDVDAGSARRVVVLHAGHDEASDVARRALPTADLRAFDFYDPSRVGGPSLARARARAKDRAPSAGLDRIPIDDASVDLALVVFAAHEIRPRTERAAFFREVARILAPAGRVRVVEHTRDAWNFLAYGPGVLHFLGRTTWQRSFADGGLVVLREIRCTPFVRVFELGRRVA